MTLVELMVTVALVSLISTLTFESYARAIGRKNTKIAVTDIVKLQLDLERYYTDTGNFPTRLADAGLARDDPWGHPYQYLNMDGAKVGKVVIRVS